VQLDTKTAPTAGRGCRSKVNPTRKRKVEHIDEVVHPVVRVFDKVTEMPEPMLRSEAERTEEAQRLLASLTEEDFPLFTSWERQTIQELNEGKASTNIRLRDLRAAVKRVHAHKK
jgi:hypothetical protein